MGQEQSPSAVVSQASVSTELLRRIDRFVDLFDRLRKRHRWAEGTFAKLSAIALSAVRNRADEMEDDLDRADAIARKDSSFFPGLFPVRRFVLATILLGSGEEPKKALKEHQRVREHLGTLGFGKGDPAAIAALILFLGSRGKAVGEESIRKAIALWEKMRERRWLPADRDDLPMAALLTSSAWDVDTIDERVDTIHQALVRAKIGRSAALPLIAHVLTLSRLDEDVVVKRYGHVLDELKRAGIKAPADCLDEVALLSLLPGDESSIVEGFSRVTRALRGRKGLRFTPSVAFGVSSGIVLGACLERGALLGEALNAGLFHNAEVLFQAEAAAVAGFGAASLAAAS